MGKDLKEKESLSIKIEIIRRLLYDKLDEFSEADKKNDRAEIQHISEILDQLIVEYLKK